MRTDPGLCTPDAEPPGGDRIAVASRQTRQGHAQCRALEGMSTTQPGLVGDKANGYAKRYGTLGTRLAGYPLGDVTESPPTPFMLRSPGAGVA